MYSSLFDYMASPDPEMVEQGVLTFARDYGLHDTAEEIWQGDLNTAILGIGSSIEVEGKNTFPWELELPNHELRLFRIEEGEVLRFVKEERIDNAHSRLEHHPIRMTKAQWRYSLQKRQAVRDWALDSVRKFLSKVIAWHQIEI